MRLRSIGSSLLWWVAAMFLLWLLLPAALLGPRAAFPFLVALIVYVATPAGIATGVYATRNGTGISLPRGLTCGAVAGLVGGWAFSKWMEQVNFFPLVADIVHSNSRMVGITLHYTIAVTIGISFALFFQRDIRGLGSSLGWGAAYGTLWWFIGPLTLLPLLTRMPINWSFENGAALFGSFVGHVMYGLILGTLYATIDRFWVRVFYESDPLNREPEGPGIQMIHALQWGVVGGALGALGAELVHATSNVMMMHQAPSISLSGGLIGLCSGAVVGALYGILFAHESRNIPDSLAWGLIFGTLSWFVGPLTFWPVFARQTFSWTPEAAKIALPDLIGALIFGLITAAVYRAFEHRHHRWLAIDPRYAARLERQRRPADTSAPAAGLFFVGAAVTLTLLFV